jgi:hypothetical protein
VVLGCLEKDPGLRYPSIAELARALLPHAHPLYEAQVDRIVGTLHAAGLTDLKPSSVQSEELPIRPALITSPDAPTLVDSEGASQPGTGRRLRNSSVVSTNARVAATTVSAPPARTPGWLKPVLLLLAVAMVVCAAFLIRSRSSGNEDAAALEPRPSAPLPAAAEKAARAPASEEAQAAPVQDHRGAVPAPPPAVSAAAPPASAPKKAARSRAAPGTPRVTRRESGSPTAAAPANSRLDIELSR